MLANPLTETKNQWNKKFFWLKLNDNDWLFTWKYLSRTLFFKNVSWFSLQAWNWFKCFPVSFFSSFITFYFEENHPRGLILRVKGQLALIHSFPIQNKYKRYKLFSLTKVNNEIFSTNNWLFCAKLPTKLNIYLHNSKI